MTRWLARFRPDPLKRLHLDREAPSELVRTSLPGASPIQESAVRSEAYRVVDGATAALPQAWRATVNAAMDERVDHTLAGFDRAIAGALGWRGSLHGLACGGLSAAEREKRGRRAQTARRTISSLILPIALVGFSPFGQTSTQFMMVWQRNSRYGSSRLSRRPAVSWSRLSAMKR